MDKKITDVISIKTIISPREKQLEIDSFSQSVDSDKLLSILG
jgi:hypothetical protein